MAELPIIETPRLRIEPFSEKHLTGRYVAWLNDPAVVRFSEQRHTHHTLDSSRRYWKSFKTSPHMFSAIMLASDDLGHIGNITVDVDLPNRVADLAIMIGDQHVWGQGYGLEAWSAAIHELLTTQNMRKVTAGTMASNSAMVSIMQRSGMVLEGRKARQFELDGAEVDLVMAACFSNEHVDLADALT